MRRFGPGVLDPSGNLDRRVLRDLIFEDPASRQALDAILHPLIRADMERQAATAKGPYLVMAIPLLVEGGQARERVHRVLVVDAKDETTQLLRVQARATAARQTSACAILASQASRTQRLAAANDVLPNTGSVADLRQAVDRLREQYLLLAQTSAYPTRFNLNPRFTPKGLGLALSIASMNSRLP